MRMLCSFVLAGLTLLTGCGGERTLSESERVERALRAHNSGVSQNEHCVKEGHMNYLGSRAVVWDCTWTFSDGEEFSDCFVFEDGLLTDVTSELIFAEGGDAFECAARLGSESTNEGEDAQVGGRGDDGLRRRLRARV